MLTIALLVNVTVYVATAVKLALSDGPGTPTGFQEVALDQKPPEVFVQAYAVAWALLALMNNPNASVKALTAMFRIAVGRVRTGGRNRVMAHFNLF